ncbi:MAG: NCS2 family permease [Bacteroidales bacterium]|nr:NCS2 family permease [Bacteroidales bacterium]
MKFLKFLGFDPEKHNVRTEIIAGLTTFLTMAYILAVNPNIFDALGGEMSKSNGAVFTATAIAAVIGTLAMAFIAKKPFALAPGMGLNAFFVYTVCLVMGHSWQFALTAVFIEGIIFVILTVSNVRKWIVDAIPISLKHAIGAGIGLFIAFIGFQNAGIVVNSDATLVTLGLKLHDASGAAFINGTALLGIIGLVVSCTLVMLHVRGGILWGILATTFIGMLPIYNVLGADGEVIRASLTTFGGVVSTPPSISGIAFQFTWSELATSKGIIDMIVVVFTFLFIDMFDTMGTLIGVSEKAGFVDEEGNVDGINQCFLADSIGTICGAALGTSTTTTYVESAAGVGAGGRTGLTAFSAACCFALALFLAPLFLAIPPAATAPSLVIVGMMMMQPVTKINWLDYRDSIPAFITLVVMPFAYSISDGILIGMISYVVLNACCGRFSKITPTMWVLAILFILRYIFI